MKLILLKNYNKILFLAPNFERGGSQKFFLKYLNLFKKYVEKPNLVILRFKKNKSYNVDKLKFEEFK